MSNVYCLIKFKTLKTTKVRLLWVLPDLVKEEGILGS